MASYRFPLSDQDDYKAKILFRTLKRTPEKIDFVNANSRQSAGNVFDNFINVFLGALTSGNLVDSYKAEGDSACLYMPSALQLRDGVNFEQPGLGAAGVAAVGAYDNTAGAMEKLKTVAQGMTGIGGEGGITKIVQAAKGNTDIGAVLASKIAGLVPGDGAGNIVNQALKTTTNPNTRATFRSVAHREFEFSFKFLPRNKTEANEISNIVKYFRTELYPRSIDLGGVSIGYEFPHMFAIAMRYNGKSIGQRLLPAYLRNVSTTYNGTSQSFYRGGDFSELDLNLSFIEYRTLTKDDITFDLDPLGSNLKGFWQNFLDGIISTETVSNTAQGLSGQTGAQ